MAEVEEHHDVHFDSADAGASLTYPQQAGTIRKNGFIVIKNRPCKVGTVIAAFEHRTLCLNLLDRADRLSMKGCCQWEARSEDASSN